MHNTYLNDNLTVPYPFFGDVKLPFACSCIQGLGICVHTNTALGALYAASVTIGPTSIYIVIAYDKLESGTYTQQILGTLFADTDTTANTGLLQDATKYQASGYLILGDIPKESCGQYSGKYYIDPSCVSYMPDSQYGYHKNIIINGDAYRIGQSLTIDANGMVALTGTAFYGTSASDTMELFTFTDSKSYPVGVTAINGVATEATGSGALTITTGNNGHITMSCLSSGGTQNGGVVVVAINGGTAFPNCYKHELDDAENIEPTPRSYKS